MFIVGILLAGLAAFLIYTKISYRKDKKCRKQVAQNVGANEVVDCIHFEGLGVGEKASCRIWSFDDRLQIDVEHAKLTFCIPMQRLRAIEFCSKEELKKMDRSVVGRALVGTLLVPGLGTIIGGMSGMKETTYTVSKFFLILNYEDKQGELKGITFRPKSDFKCMPMMNFALSVNKHRQEATELQTIEL